MQTSNPVFNSSTYKEAPSWMGALSDAQSKPKTMSVQGTALKTLYLLAITIVTAAVSFSFYRQNTGLIMPTIIGSLIGGFVSSIIMLKKPQISSFVVPIFAFCEGLFVAAISVGIVAFFLGEKLAGTGDWGPAYAMIGQAAGLSLAITGAMLFGYATGVLRLSNFAMKVIGVMVAGVMFYYLGSFIVNMITGSNTIPRLDYSAEPLGIAFSGFVIVLASLMLLLDFRFVEDGVQRGLPKYYEWIGAFGILTTVVWLYIEILKLLAKLKSE